MFAVAKTSSEIEAYNSQSTASKNGADPQAMQDKFMKMLVAQLNNQDPLNPMDNAQMTSQMAQINTVSGIQQLNETMQNMATQFGSLQALQGVSLIGRTAMVEGYTPLVQDDKASGGLRLDAAAQSVKVDVLDKAGKVLGSVNLGPLQAGQHSFEVPLAGADPATVGSFKVTALNGDTAVAAKGISFQPIASVGMKDGAIQLTAGNGKTYGYGDVLGYR